MDYFVNVKEVEDFIVKIREQNKVSYFSNIMG